MLLQHRAAVSVLRAAALRIIDHDNNRALDTLLIAGIDRFRLIPALG